MEEEVNIYKSLLVGDESKFIDQSPLQTYREMMSALLGTCFFFVC